MNKKIKLVGLILLITTGQILYGQTSNKEYEAKRTEKIEKPNAIFFAPLNLFDFDNPNFQIGYERFVAKKWSLQIEGGIIINHSIENYVIDWIKGIKVSECPYTNNGFRVKGSVKYFLVDKRKFKLYVSPELFYSKNKSGIARSFVVSDPDFEYSFEIPEWWDDEKYLKVYTLFFYNDEEKMGMNFKAGIKLFIGKRFFIEPHLGLGFAYRNIIQTGIENPNDKIYDNLVGFFGKTAPNKWVPTLPINFKMGLRF